MEDATTLSRLRDVEQRLVQLEMNLTKPRHAPPAKVTEGLFQFADGTDWNPGSGRGLYQYVSGVWVKL